MGRTSARRLFSVTDYSCLALDGGAHRIAAEGPVVEVEAPLRLRIDVTSLI